MPARTGLGPRSPRNLQIVLGDKPAEDRQSYFRRSNSCRCRISSGRWRPASSRCRQGKLIVERPSFRRLSEEWTTGSSIKHVHNVEGIEPFVVGRFSPIGNPHARQHVEAIPQFRRVLTSCRRLIFRPDVLPHHGADSFLHLIGPDHRSRIGRLSSLRLSNSISARPRVLSVGRSRNAIGNHLAVIGGERDSPLLWPPGRPRRRVSARTTASFYIDVDPAPPIVTTAVRPPSGKRGRADDRSFRRWCKRRPPPHRSDRSQHNGCRRIEPCRREPAWPGP